MGKGAEKYSSVRSSVKTGEGTVVVGRGTGAAVRPPGRHARRGCGELRVPGGQLPPSIVTLSTAQIATIKG
jgi:hypothetical protein